VYYKFSLQQGTLYLVSLHICTRVVAEE
jgi:hypothetical protein